MKFSYNWLSELVPGLTTGPDEIGTLITMKTAECEGVVPFGRHLGSIRAVRVLSVTELPKGKNREVVIETPEGEQKHVVCGAPNVQPGMFAAWVPPGTDLNGTLISRVKISGVESEGMLASGAELGINREASGILQLTSASELAGLRPDWIIEIDNKSLTHRPDLWGHYGMAREIAAITSGVLKDPVDASLLAAPELRSGAPRVRVEIEDFSLCPRYSALCVENVRIGPAPLWLQARLEGIGLNGINNIVDLTNLILAELPQPMHAFDADKLHGDTIFIRPARVGEKLAALNGESYSLVPADLVIADASGPIALAGVIGGADTAISAETTRVVFESANFGAASVRLTSARHKLRTDASMRFEKALDPENTARGLARAIALLQDLAPGARILGPLADVQSERPAAAPITIEASFVSRKLGKQIPSAETQRILSSLGFGVTEHDPGTLNVTVPSWRSTKDISLKDDLVEEIGRMVGYDTIVPTAPVVAATVPPSNPERAYARKLRGQLSAQGFTEVSNYSFVSDAELAGLSLNPEEHIRVLNPIVWEQAKLRTSLLPGLLRNIVTNERNFADSRIFELGVEIHGRPGNALPVEIPHAAAVLYSQHGTEDDFFEMKRVIECLFPGARLHPVAARAYEHPMRTAGIEWHNCAIGRAFEMHPVVLQKAGVQGRAVVFDVDLERAYAVFAGQTIQYQPLRRFPTSGFDLSVIAPLQLPVASIEEQLRQLGGARVVLVEFVRQYSGPPLPEGTKSVSYHLEVGADDHTLTAEEAGEIRNALIEGMREHGYELRV